jgi:hypothetical protein
MALFGGGKPNKAEKNDHKGGNKDEAGYFDSPTENVSLAAPVVKPTPSVIVQREEPPPTVDFGINQAIQLMRSLPVDQNPELVVTVIKTTLESLRVKVPDIIADASRKQANLESRVETLSKEIVDYEREIQQRKEEIARLEADHAETTSVKSRLELAERGTGGSTGGAQAKTAS